MLLPGGTHHFEVEYDFFNANQVLPRYQRPDGFYAYATLTVGPFGGIDVLELRVGLLQSESGRRLLRGHGRVRWMRRAPE